MECSWDDVRLLLALDETGSLARAGKLIGVDTSTVSRRIARLESELATVLVDRRSDGVRVTEAGRALCEVGRRMKLELDAGLRDLPAASGELRGTVRISTGDGFAELVVAAIERFAKEHDDVRFELDVGARLLSLEKREADLGVRSGPAREPSLVYRQVGALRNGLYASSEYLTRRGAPASRHELASHRFVALGGPEMPQGSAAWLQSIGVGSFALLTGAFLPMELAIRRGIGIGVLPDLRAKGLVRVLPDVEVPATEVAVVHHPEVRRLEHVRRFGDCLAAVLREAGAA